MMKKFLFLIAVLLLGNVFTTDAQESRKQKVVKEITDTTITGGKVITINGEEVQAIEDEHNLDSLLSIWYLKRALQDSSGIYTLREGEVIPAADLPDSVYINRLKAMPGIIDLPYNHIVRSHIILYTQKIAEKSEMILGLGEFYLPIIEGILDQYDMPIELRAMAIIESAFNQRAVSRAKAKGMWQFMYGTAKMYGLTMNSYVEERYDPIAATHAAARHMKDLYDIFGDWSLAIAAYNCGTGNVQKAIRRAGNKRDYWEIYNYLPRETRGYVPAFVAASYLLKYYKEHGLCPKKIEMPAHVDTFYVNKMLHFDQVSAVIDIPVDELRNYNPQYIRDVIPGTERPYVLRIPYEYTAAFAEKEKEIYAYKDSIYNNPNIIRNVGSRVSMPSSLEGRSQLTHRVQKGETLGEIAQKYRVSVSDLRYWNDIRGNIIKPNQKLIVYAKGAAPKKSSTTTASSGQAKTSSSGGYIMHTVKKNENLWSIAQNYDDVSYYDIMNLNGFSKNQKIFPGDKIKIKKL